MSNNLDDNSVRKSQINQEGNWEEELSKNYKNYSLFQRPDFSYLHKVNSYHETTTGNSTHSNTNTFLSPTSSNSPPPNLALGITEEESKKYNDLVYFFDNSNTARYGRKSQSAWYVQDNLEIKPLVYTKFIKSDGIISPFTIKPSLLDHFHAVTLPDKATPEKVEALAVSYWKEVYWLGPKILALDDIYLHGEYNLADFVPIEFAPPKQKKIWLLECKKMPRKKIVDDALKKMDPWAKYFPEGTPTGVEFSTLTKLRKLITKLKGTLRIAPTGVVIMPENNAATLRIYTPNYLSRRWIEENLTGFYEEPNKISISKAKNSLFERQLADYSTSNQSYTITGKITDIILWINVTLAEVIPFPLRYVKWDERTIYLIEVQGTIEDKESTPWLNSQESYQEQVSQTVDLLTSRLVAKLPDCVVLDSNDFIVNVERTSIN